MYTDLYVMYMLVTYTSIYIEVVTPRPPPFSTGLGTGYGGVVGLLKALID
jgi:hypothetical protein